MKNDLVTAIAVAILGTVVAYFVANMLIGDIEQASVKSITGNFASDVSDPNPEVFNYKSINPTVEVYVGDSSDGNCISYDSQGNCVSRTSGQENTGPEPTKQEDL